MCRRRQTAAACRRAGGTTAGAHAQRCRQRLSWAHPAVRTESVAATVIPATPRSAPSAAAGLARPEHSDCQTPRMAAAQLKASRSRTDDRRERTALSCGRLRARRRAAVLLLHGFPECAHAWRHQLEALGAAGLRAIAPDQRGYGRTDKPIGTRSYAIDALAEDVVEIAAALGHRRSCWSATTGAASSPGIWRRRARPSRADGDPQCAAPRRRRAFRAQSSAAVDQERLRRLLPIAGDPGAVVDELGRRAAGRRARALEPARRLQCRGLADLPRGMDPTGRDDRDAELVPRDGAAADRARRTASRCRCA